ncbi:hypothetical protein ACFW1A_04290 [Kitasatospora sp. NPDC058965]|uniref:hypothetical protein n=1 Tax=Kitasatospora sp. NPDC058965 TaxID=3346682 RepID=UPI00368441CF
MQRTGSSVKQKLALVLAAGTAVVAAGVGLCVPVGHVATAVADGTPAPSATATPNGDPTEWS